MKQGMAKPERRKSESVFKSRAKKKIRQTIASCGSWSQENLGLGRKTNHKGRSWDCGVSGQKMFAKEPWLSFLNRKDLMRQK